MPKHEFTFPELEPVPPRYGRKALLINLVTTALLGLGLLLTGLAVKVIALGVVGMVLLVIAAVGSLQLIGRRRD